MVYNLDGVDRPIPVIFQSKIAKSDDAEDFRWLRGSLQLIEINKFRIRLFNYSQFLIQRNALIKPKINSPIYIKWKCPSCAKIRNIEKFNKHACVATMGLVRKIVALEELICSLCGIAKTFKTLNYHMHKDHYEDYVTMQIPFTRILRQPAKKLLR